MSSEWYPNLPYSPLFPIVFKKEKERIQKYIKKSIIEHIGSTSVPNLDGKGYIDLMVCVPKELMKHTKKTLEAKLRYEYKKDVSVKGKREFFKKIASSQYSDKTFYHLHLTYLNSQYHKEAINFRDFLIKNPKYTKKYSEIKKIASKEAQKASNRKTARTIYKNIKDPLIRKILIELEKNKN